MVWGTKYGRFTPINISKYEHFTSKSIKITHILCVRSGDFCRFKLALPSLLFLSKDKVKAAHSDFDCCLRGVICAPKILPIGIFLGQSLIDNY